ncbi:hypothetical protein CAPTEDRAFT_228928 [Capitella teleta]|uniref:Uncharacterized protein n=1 Tax=Capitella teleta TaxID=283909 RepID=R7U106_CAPTE|nr:hypothetical protein CAPTEDRAFT_228928 [Capitella teleta]|eukprot:ELT99689.1 hypothetical protein CAPTEDRAFT_228928 [Capitella teleta]
MQQQQPAMQQQLLQQHPQQQPQPWQYSQHQLQPQMMQSVLQPSTTERPGFNKKGVFIMGIVQIVFACICILLQVVAIATQTGFYQLGYGIWCSIFYIIAGALSIGASKTSSSCMILASMVLCIFAAISACLHVGFAAGSIPFILGDNSYLFDPKIQMGPAIFIQVLAMLISLAEFAVAITTSVYDCKATCCSTPAQANQSVQYVTLADGQTIPVVILGPNSTPGQPIMINPGMVMPQQQPGLSTCIQTEAPPAYEVPTEGAPSETKGLL